MTEENLESENVVNLNKEDVDFLNELDKLQNEYSENSKEETFTTLEDGNLMDVEFSDAGELRISEATVNALKQAMKDVKIVGSQVSLFEQEVKFDKSKLAGLLKMPILIVYNHKTDSLVFKSENSEEIEDILTDIESIKPIDADEWICDRLPEPTFSTTYSNQRKMEKEARAVYKLIVYSKICKNDWTPEFYRLLRNYDFSALAVKEGFKERFNDFSDMLSYVSSNARLLGKYVLSACNTKFIKQKRPTDPGFASLLSSAEVSELEKLGIMRNNLIKASKIALQNVEMSWQKGQINYELKLRLDNIFNGNYDDGDVFNKDNSDNLFKGMIDDVAKLNKTNVTKFKRICGLLFKASLLNTEVLSEADVSTINRIVNRIARKELNLALDVIVPEEKYEDFKNLVAKLKKIAVKLRVAQYKRDAVSSIRGANDNLDNVLIRSKR